MKKLPEEYRGCETTKEKLLWIKDDLSVLKAIVKDSLFMSKKFIKDLRLSVDTNIRRLKRLQKQGAKVEIVLKGAKAFKKRVKNKVKA